MNRAPMPRVDLRAFRWSLHPLERKFEGTLEAARLALASLRGRQHALQHALTQGKEHQAAQARHAAESLRAEPRLRSHALGYLATLQREHEALDAQVTELQAQVDLARQACADRLRQLASVEALRREAQRQHAQAQARREAREADTAWLALDQRRRASLRLGMEAA